MPFPESKRVIYEKNPLVNVICQLRFPPILKIDSEIPAQFQDFIKEEYPIYEELTEIQSEVPSRLSPQFPESIIKQLSKTVVNKNHGFTSIDGIWKINLTRTFLSISSSKYITWEDFSDRFKKPFEALVKIYQPPFFTRIGIRFIDIIDRSKLNLQDASWRDLLQPYFLGLLSSDIEKSIRSYENAYEIELENIESKVRIVTSFVHNMQNEEVCFQIDSDFYSPSRTSIEKTWEELNYLHERSSRLIRWVVTDKLHDAMIPNPIELNK